MKEIFEQLQRMQSILFEKYKVEDELKELPHRLTTKEEVLSRLRYSQHDHQQSCDSKQKELHLLRLEMETVEKRREELEGKMNSIKTQREYEALDKEIMEAGQNEQRLRRQVQHFENDLTELRSLLERNKNMIALQEEELKSEREQMAVLQQRCEDKLQGLSQEEGQLSPDLNSELLFKFDRILRSREGLGIVPLTRGICTGCHMILPAQFVGDVRRGENVHFCPYCSRILYYRDSQEGDSFLEIEEDSEEIGALADVLGDQESADFYDFDDFEEED